MSQIDVRNAKTALAHRLRVWECPGDVSQLAEGFIDDLVAKGWQMAPFLETRPEPPLLADACGTCGKGRDDCERNPLNQHPEHGHPFVPATRRLPGARRPVTTPTTGGTP